MRRTVAAAASLVSVSSPEDDWSWDRTLYAGSAPYYALGRVAYPDELAVRLAAALRLDGTGSLLDIGCGPGSLTLLLAPHFARVTGLDADPDMLTEAATLAARQGIENVTWRHLRAEELPAELGPFSVVALAQSFHWMDRPRVARVVRGMLAPGGVLVHVSATTHRGIDPPPALPHPTPPHQAIDELVRSYLGPHRRAGQGVRTRPPPSGEDEIYRAAGFTGPERLLVPGRIVERTPEQLVASVYSLSSSAPHLFGDRLERFDADLRRLLAQATPEGRFSEQMREIAVDIWR